jgi:predicted amidohydrolase YtcJ
VGKLADLAVLSADYFKVPVEEIGDIESVMTVVGGKVVHAEAPYVQVEQR